MPPELQSQSQHEPTQTIQPEPDGSRTRLGARLDGPVGPVGPVGPDRACRSDLTLEGVDHLRRGPFAAAASRPHAARSERPGDATEAADATRLDLLDDGPDVSRERIGGRATGGKGTPTSFRQARPAELLAPRLGCGEGGLGTLADGLALMLGDSGQNVDGELVGMRVIDRDKLDAAIHQRGDEGEVAGQPVELGNDELGLVLAAGEQRLGQLRAIRTLAALNLGVLGDEPPRAAVQVGLDGLPLRLKAEAGGPLLIGGNTIVCNELAEMCAQNGLLMAV